jgi:anionic cell wall polymer biosynthesis LytR-Cps2A-Psr (LCP) family protein
MRLSYLLHLEIIVALTAISLVALPIFWSKTRQSYAWIDYAEPPPTQQPMFSQVLAAETAPPTPAPAEPDVNILLLGLDSRKEDKSARCDAIHMFSFRPSQNKLMIFSVPRGTMAKDGNIIANVCSIYGFATAQEEIEQITGVKANHVVKVGFSQVQGISRLAGLPAEPTLEYLRDRHSYAIGDNQRSYNQAVFFKDMILTRFETAAKLPEAVQYLGFRMLDTDISFSEARDLEKTFLASGVFKDPAKIQIQIRPVDAFKRQDIHLDDKLTQNEDWQNDPEYLAYQKDMTKYLENVTNKAKVDLAIAKRLWLQIENPEDRNRLHLRLLQLAPSREAIQDFILEMTQAGNAELKAKGEELLTALDK